MTLRELRSKYPHARIGTFDKDGLSVYVSSMSWKVLSYEVIVRDGLEYVYARLDY